MELNSGISLGQFQQMVKNQPVSTTSTKSTTPTVDIKIPLKEDTCSFSRDIVAVVTGSIDEYDSGVLTTKVNNKDGHLKLSEPRKREAWIEGDIDGKKILIHKQGNVYAGKYGDKDFELNVDTENPPSWIKRKFSKKSSFNCNRFNVDGTLGGEKVSINLPEAKIPQNEDFKDVLAMLLWANHYKAKTINGDIKTVEYSNDGYRHKLDMEAMEEKTKEKFWNNPVITTCLGIFSALAVSLITKKYL